LQSEKFTGYGQPMVAARNYETMKTDVDTSVPSNSTVRSPNLVKYRKLLTGR